jgi:hypothetical protein
MRENLRMAFHIGLLGGSLIWSVNCSSAPVTATAESSPAPVTAAGGPKCDDIQAPILIHHVMPNYPREVQRQGMEGKVVVEAVLTPDGTVEDFRPSRARSVASQTLQSRRSAVALQACDLQGLG